MHCALTNTKKPGNFWSSRDAHHMSHLSLETTASTMQACYMGWKKLCGNVLLHLGSEGWSVQCPEEGNRDNDMIGMVQTISKQSSEY